MKKILISLMVIGLVAALTGGGVFSYFSDTETSPGNTFTAGTLNLTYYLDRGTGDGLRGAQDGTGDMFFLDPLRPGNNGCVKYKLENAGNTPGYAEVSTLWASHSEGTTPESETDKLGIGDLGDDLQVLIWFDKDDDGNTDFNEKLVWAEGDTDSDGVVDEGEKIKARDIGSLSGFHDDSNVRLGKGETTILRINWTLPRGTGDDVQGDVATVDITFELAQTTGQ